MKSLNIPKIDTRDKRFDVLKAIGLLCIILAHVHPPEVIRQLRNFDVPLMVVISGALFGLSYSGKNISYLEYAKKRIKRLAVPTWTFLIIFYVVAYIVCMLVNYPFRFSVDTILSSFALIWGFGYVWIIRVFLLMALIAPFVFAMNKRLEYNHEYFGSILAIYALYEIFAYHYTFFGVPLLDGFIEYVIMYAVPYGCMFALGLRLPQLANRTIDLIAALFFVIFTMLAVINCDIYFVPIQTAKYPPMLYYLSYSVLVSMLLYRFVNTKYANVLKNDWLVFISSSSLWIYLWHVLIVYAWNFYVMKMPYWLDNFVMMFAVVFSISFAITYIQKIIVQNMMISEHQFPGKKLLIDIFRQ